MQIKMRFTDGRYTMSCVKFDQGHYKGQWSVLLVVDGVDTIRALFDGESTPTPDMMDALKTAYALIYED